MNLDNAKLRDLTFRKGLNQRKVMELTGISRPTLNGVYCGRSCSEATATKIADVLGVPLQDIQKRNV